LGKLTEARDLAKQAYEVFLHQFGPEHPNIKIAEKLRIDWAIGVMQDVIKNL